MGNGIRVSNVTPVSSTCGGSIASALYSTTLQLADLTVPASSSCTFVAEIRADADGALTYGSTYVTNTLPTGNITYDVGGSTGQVYGYPVTSNQIYLAQAINVSKSFNPPVVGPLGVSRLSLNITRTSMEHSATNDVMLIDNLPTGHTVAPVPNVANSCGGTVTAVPGSNQIKLQNGTFPMPGGMCRSHARSR
ncbi:MAG: hypothetical protein U1E15_12005 [Hyphomicrobiales bacterium]